MALAREYESEIQLLDSLIQEIRHMSDDDENLEDIKDNLYQILEICTDLILEK